MSQGIYRKMCLCPFQTLVLLLFIFCIFRQSYLIYYSVTLHSFEIEINTKKMHSKHQNNRNNMYSFPYIFGSLLPGHKLPALVSWNRGFKFEDFYGTFFYLIFSQMCQHLFLLYCDLINVIKFLHFGRNLPRTVWIQA